MVLHLIKYFIWVLAVCEWQFLVAKPTEDLWRCSAEKAYCAQRESRAFTGYWRRRYPIRSYWKLNDRITSLTLRCWKIGADEHVFGERLKNAHLFSKHVAKNIATNNSGRYFEGFSREEENYPILFDRQSRARNRSIYREPIQKRSISSSAAVNSVHIMPYNNNETLTRVTFLPNFERSSRW